MKKYNLYKCNWESTILCFTLPMCILINKISVGLQIQMTCYLLCNIKKKDIYNNKHCPNLIMLVIFSVIIEMDKEQVR